MLYNYICITYVNQYLHCIMHMLHCICVSSQCYLATYLVRPKSTSCTFYKHLFENYEKKGDNVYLKDR